MLADPLLAPVVTPERGRELLGTPRAGRTEPVPEPVPDLDPPGLGWLAARDGWWGEGYRLVLVEGVAPEQLVELFGHEDQSGLAAPATADELRDRRIEVGNRRAGNPWDDRALMTVGRAGSGWSFAFAGEYAPPDADRLRSPAVPASRATPDGRAVALWCTPGREPQAHEPAGPFAFHVSVARGGELEYAVTVEPPRRAAPRRSTLPWTVSARCPMPSIRTGCRPRPPSPPGPVARARPSTDASSRRSPTSSA
ncbi:hypothetical protein ACU686_11870 [Yinghuangia aomiensis]